MGIKSGLYVTKDNHQKILKRAHEVLTKDVVVGIPAEEAPREDGEVTNPQLGYIHENGAPEANIPGRPFLVPGIRKDLPNTVKYLAAAARATLDGDPERADKNLHAAGFSATVSVQKRIQSGPFAPLASSTLRARLRRGRTGTKPLIDTAQLLRSIVHVVRDKLKGVKNAKS